MALKVPKPAVQTVERMSGTRCDNSASDSTRIYAILFQAVLFQTHSFLKFRTISSYPFELFKDCHIRHTSYSIQ